MSEKKPKVAKVKVVETKAIVMHEIALSQRQQGIMRMETPPALIKSKPGRGGKKVAYVEGGYVISKLNEAFSPLGWEFTVLEHGKTDRCNEKSAEGEVWVKGQLTIIDHVKGYRVNKIQFGQHPIHKNVPIGDAYKAASTDALKKCASMIGIALDVYWGTLDTNDITPPAKPNANELFERAKTMIRTVGNVSALIEYEEKMREGKLFTKQQKDELTRIIKDRANQIDSQQE